MESAPTFEAIGNRSSQRRFSQKEVSDSLLFELLELSNRAPSGYNLQPWHFVLVRDQEVKTLLSHVALDQKQILEAYATVVFVADPKAWKDSYPTVLRDSIAQGIMDEKYANFSRNNVSMLFRTGPVGLFGLMKKITLPLRRFKEPTPQLIASKTEAESYVKSHTMLAAATFMIAATGAGLATCPIEGFDEYRLKRLLVIPKHMCVPMIISVGYAIEGDEQVKSYRTPLVKKLSADLFPNKLEKLKNKG